MRFRVGWFACDCGNQQATRSSNKVSTISYAYDFDVARNCSSTSRDRRVRGRTWLRPRSARTFCRPSDDSAGRARSLPVDDPDKLAHQFQWQAIRLVCGDGYYATPLGILSGIGFIGAGAIIKRGELAIGVTTAATIWFVTVMGLCFGGGQIGLGFAGFVLGFGVLIGLKRIETYTPRQHSGILRIAVTVDGPTQSEIASLLARSGISPTEPSLSFEGSPDMSTVYGWKIRWKGSYEDPNPPRAIQELAVRSGILKLEFTR